jgi:uncharacterized protein (TIGR03067 family)
MRVSVLALTLGLFATGAWAQQASLAGAWTAVEAERDGAPATDVVGHRLTFEGGSFEIAAPDGRQVYAGIFRSDASADPRAIDFRNTQGEAAGADWAGIWRLEGTVLTIVDNAPDPSRPRPTDFAAPAGSGYILVVFQRAD